MNFFESLFLTFTHAFYWLVSNALMMVEIFQFLFRKLAGLDTYYLNGEKIEKSGDLVLQIIKKTFFSGENNEYSVIAVTFWSIVIIASILLFVTTIAAIIRVEYSPNKANPGEPKSKGTSKGKIIGNFLKAIISFVIVPIACYFGLFLGNSVLFAIDSATNTTTTSLISVDANIYNKIESQNDTYIFNIFFGQIAPANTTPIAGLANRVALYSANRVRNDKNFYESVVLYEESAEGLTTNFGIFNVPDNQDEAANLIDALFAMNAKLKTPQTLDSSKAPTSSFIWSTPTTQIEYFNRYDIGLVNYYYDLKSYNWIVAIFFVWILAKTMITFTFGLITRIFSMLALLMIGPLVMAMMPLDGGSGLSSWGKSFVEKAISAYTAIFSMNILFMIIPIFQTFQMFGPGFEGWGFVDLVIQMLLIGAGLLAVSKVDEIVAKSLHSGSLYKEGGDLSKQVNDTFVQPIAKGIKTTADFAVGAGMAIATGGASLASSGGGSIASKLGGLFGAKVSGNMPNDGKDRGTLSKRDQKNVEQASKTDSQIKKETLNKVEKDIQNEYNNNFQNKTNQAYQDYQSRGGTMSQQDFFENTKKGSYIDADHRWETMSSQERSHYSNKNDFLKEYHETYNPGRSSEFSNWKDEGRQLKKSDKGISDNKNATFGDVERQMGLKKDYVEKRRKEVMDQMVKGVADEGDKLAQKAIQEMERETQKTLNAKMRLVKRKKANQAQQVMDLGKKE